MHLTRRHFIRSATGLLAATGLSRWHALAASPANPGFLRVSLDRGEWWRTDFDVNHDGLSLLRRPDGTFAANGTFCSPPLPVPPAGSWSVRWLPRWTTPMAWDKHAGNPVLQRPAGAAAESGGVSLPCVVKTPAGLRLYHGARPAGIGLATAAPGEFQAWQRRPGSVLEAGPAGTFDAGGVNAPEVVQVSGDHWRMYYVGYHPTGRVDGVAVHQIGLAESHDGGISWHRHSDQPVIPHGAPGSYDAFATSSASVLRVGGQWWMWYGGIAQVPYRAGICLATSDDGVAWRKFEGNPVLPFSPELPGESTVVAKPHVLHEDGLFKMWYSSRGREPGDYRIGYAESRDGLTWERFPHNPVVKPSPQGWDHLMVEYAEVLHDESGYHLWYSGDDYDSVGYAHGRATATVEVRFRTGNTPAPDGTWSAWSSPCANPTGTPLGFDRERPRHVQLQLSLATTDPRWSPLVQDCRLVQTD